MFFEPPPPETDLAGRLPELPQWAGPPMHESGGVLPVDLIVAGNEVTVVALPMIRAFRAGCMLGVDVVLRRSGLSTTDWWDLQLSVHHLGLRAGDPLPAKLMRLGVRYADGTKATTLDRPAPGAVPEGPLLTWSPVGSGGGRGGGQEIGFHHFGLWLWPAPPAEPFEFAVEWPAGGIGLTITELDGAAILAAAARSARYWPDR